MLAREVFHIFTNQNRKRGVGSLIGAVFILLILISGYSLFMFNAKSQTEYQNILNEMHNKDLERNQENLDISRVTMTEEGYLKISIRNLGPQTAHVLYIGIFDKTSIPEVQNYFDVSLYIDPTETIQNINSDIILYDGKEYEVQIVTENGNIFSEFYKPGYEVFSDMAISIISGGIWESDFKPDSYNIDRGNLLGGTWPGSILLKDNNYLVVESIYSSGGTSSYYPAFHNPVNATTYISGGLADLSGNDGIYMKYQGFIDFLPEQYYPSSTSVLDWTQYISGTALNLILNDGNNVDFFSFITRTSTITPSKAIVGITSNDLSGNSYPKVSEFDGTWSVPSEIQESEGQIRDIRVASCNLEERSFERIIVTMSVDDTLDAYVFNGTNWEVTNFGDMDGRDNRPFDIAYEGTSGRALLVYGNKLNDNTKDLSYRIWDGRTWSQEDYFDDTTQSSSPLEYRWISLVPNPTSGSNEIAFAGIDHNNGDVNVVIWDGSQWKDFEKVINNIPSSNYESVAVAYEYSSGNLMVVTANGDLVRYVYYTGTWSTPSQFDINTASKSVMRYFVLRTHHYAGSNRIMLLSLDDARDLCAIDWNGSSWGTRNNLDSNMETDTSRCADGDWEPGTTNFVLFGGDSGVDSLSYKTWTPEGGWNLGPNSWNTYAGLTTDQRLVQVKADPRGVGNAKLLIGTIDDGSDLVLSTWDGTTISYQTELSNDLGGNDREIMDIEFNLFGNPEEFTCKFEMEGVSPVEIWGPLTWNVDSSITESSSDVVLQLFNYNTDSYPTSGDGYISYTSSSTPDIDELYSQYISLNPEYFRNATGAWKIKATIVKETDTPIIASFDLVELEPLIQYKKCIVEFLGSSNSDPWINLDWELDSSWNNGDVLTTYQLYDYFSGEYSTSGDGYVAYNSSSTSSTDETKIQSISNAPWRFRDPSGGWKIQITGIKKTGSSLELSVDKVSYATTGGSNSVETEYTFTGVPTLTLQGLRCITISEHNETFVGVELQIWNYITGAYDSLGEGYTSYTSTTENETALITITSGVSQYVNNGEVKIRLKSQFSNPFTQNINKVQLDYSHISPMLPFDTWQTYIINVMDAATGDPRPFIGLTIFVDGTTAMFDGEPNPVYVAADSNGKYIINLKSSTWSGETFKIHVFVGSVAAEKTIVQAPWGS